MKKISDFFIKIPKRKLLKIVTAIALDFGPILIFIISFKFVHVYSATLILMATTIIATLITYTKEKRLPFFALYIAFLTIIFGYFTIHNRNPEILQLRDTLYDSTIAVTLLIGLIYGKLFIKESFKQAVDLTNEGWKILTYGWSIFFVISAGTNEYVRRMYSFHDWIHFKGFMIFFTAIFGLFLFYIVYVKNKKYLIIK